MGGWGPLLGPALLHLPLSGLCSNFYAVPNLEPSVLLPPSHFLEALPPTGAQSSVTSPRRPWPDLVLSLPTDGRHWPGPAPG